MKATNKSKIILLILNLLLPLFIVSAQSFTVKGKITSGGRGVPAVNVTDGTSFVQTDKKGNFSISVSPESKLVYYTLPAGYESPAENGIPVFYAPLRRDVKGQTVNFELIKSAKSQQRHAFVYFGDPQVSDESELELLKDVVADADKTLKSMSGDVPVHGISAGDNVFDKLNLFPRYKEVLKTLNIPFYQSIGNHDMNYNERSNELSDVSFSAAFGPSHYSFNKGNIHYVVLKDVFYYGNSYRYIGYIDERQLAWLEKDLQSVAPGSTVIVSLHIPTTYGESKKPRDYPELLSNEVMNKKALYEILKPYNTHILAGHSHTQWNNVYTPTLFEHVHAATCAAWWQGEKGTDGTPKGYTVYTVDGNDLSWYFKGVNQDKTEQFRLYPTGTDLTIADYFVANVYNYDPAWKVSWYEDGIFKGEMQRYWGKDPQAVNTYDNNKSKKYSWISATDTHHLFKAKPEKAESKIQVIVTDRFGNNYEKSFNNTILSKKSESGSWSMVWNDEFNYTGLPDAGKWSYDTKGNDTGWGNNEAQFYTENDSSNAWVSDGLLRIKARNKTIGNKRFTSARLITKGKGDWLYGRFEIRAKLPTGRGTWPAIWMLSTDWEYGGWPRSGEIDIMENVGYNPDTIFASAHTQTYNHIIGTQKTKGIYCPTSYTDYHVYTLEWDKDEYRIYLDNTHYYTFVNEGTGPDVYPFDKRFHLILNLAIGGNWGGSHGIQYGIVPCEMLVDYVRVYKKE